MKTQFLPLQQAAESACADGMTRGRILAAAVAIAVAASLPLPTSEVGAVSSHYTLQLKHAAELQLSPFNEEFVFDYGVALEYVRQFWMVRYHVAFPLTRPIYGPSGSFFDAIGGVAVFVSPEDQTFLDKQRNKILHLATYAKTCLSTEV